MGQHIDILEKYFSELAMQPYASNLLFYLIFEDFTDNVQAASRAFKNCTDFDYIVFISLMSENQRSNGLRNYFDVNRMMKLRDKFDEQDAITILENVIDRLILISEQVESSQFIYKT